MPDNAIRMPIELADNHLDTIKKYGYSFLLKKTTGSSRVYYEDGAETLFCNRKLDRKFLTVMSCVVNNARKFYRQNKKIPRLNKNYIVNYCSPNVKNFQYEEVALTDVKICYPTIALNKGIISQSTFERVCEYSGEDKKRRQMCIGILAMTYNYEKYEEGKLIENWTEYKDKSLKRVHNIILEECDKMMFDLIKLLKDDFLMFMTDCVYYKKSKENIKKVHDYFKKKKLQHTDLKAFMLNYNEPFNRIHWSCDGDRSGEYKYYPVGINHKRVQSVIKKNKSGKKI